MSDGILRRMLNAPGCSADELRRFDRESIAAREANAKPEQQRTGRLVRVGVGRLGVTSYVYWRCADCGTDYPVLHGNAAPSCNGSQISRCPWCRPPRVLP